MKKLSIVLLLVAAGCGNSTVTQQSGTAACVTAAACNIIAGGVVGCANAVVALNDTSVAAQLKISASEVNCIAEAGSDCAKAKKCLANNQVPATCSGVAASCSGSVWQGCTIAAGSGTNQGTQLYDCAPAGQTCVTNGTHTDCGYGTCSGLSSSCVTPDGTSGGNLVQTCNNGILEREDCGKIDASCNPSGFAAHCRGNGPACSGNNALRCDGDTLVSCTDGQESREDCTKFQLHCLAKKDGSGFACLAGTECDAQDAPTCMGSTLQFCNNGKTQKFDCAAAGFTGCSPNGGGSCS